MAINVGLYDVEKY